MKSGSKGKKVKLRKPILAQKVSDKQVFVLDSDSSTVFQLSGLEAQVVSVLFDSVEKSGMTMEEIIEELERLSGNKAKRAQILDILCNLEAMLLTEKSALTTGRKPPKRLADIFKLSTRQKIALGALSVGAGMFWNPSNAPAANCVGPPSCTAGGPACAQGAGCVCSSGKCSSPSYGTKADIACDAGCS